MVKFLVDRPIAVIMTFVALLALGWVSYTFLPVSLMPDIAIPEITVHYSYPHSSARELENAVTAPLRRQLLQVGNLADIKSETRDGTGMLHLRFKYGINTHYAFIEVNEKIDAAIHSLPRDMERPRVFKANATDIPVFYSNVSLRPSETNTAPSENDFLELSNFVSAVIRHRIEQLPEVAMVDMSGATEPQLMILPDPARMKSLNLTTSDIESALNMQNISAGSLWVREGDFRYNIRLTSSLTNREDVSKVTIKSGNRIIPLQEIATIRIEPQQKQGMFVSNGQPAIALAIIKQSEARMGDMTKNLNSLIKQFEHDYPEMKFDISQDQTALLNFSISNLKQNLTYGILLMCLILFLFENGFRAPLLVTLTVPISVIICLIFFYFAGMSFNIISLSGLIMAVGMMVDNSIIVSDNIGQFRKRGLSLSDACVSGTTEVIRPLITSALTTITIFVPLIFLSGIAGALFFDQAMGVSIGLGVSVFVSITLLPVLYKVFYLRKPLSGLSMKREPLMVRIMVNLYKKSLNFALRKPLIIAGIAILFSVSTLFLFQKLDITRLPKMTQVDTMIYIDWNEQIHPDENNFRIGRMLDSISIKAFQENRFVGQQQFLINQGMDMGFSETQIYLEYSNTNELQKAKNEITKYMQQYFPLATFRLYPPATLFDRIFESGNAPFVAALTPMRKTVGFTTDEISHIIAQIDDTLETPNAHSLSFREHLRIEIDYEKLLLYNVNYNTLIQELRTACQENNIGLLRSYRQFVPIVIGGETQIISEMLNSLKVRNADGTEIPFRALTKLHREYDMKTITAGKDGEYVPVSFNISNKEYPIVATKIQQVVDQNSDVEVRFFGTIFENRQMLRELILVLIISILMIYFILAAQFESLIQPIILLIELPIDIGAALFILWITGHTLNLMSAIGIIVMCGIIINDSILKIDSYNNLRCQGMTLDEAIHTTGDRRLKAIVLTSLTTILAVTPLLFTKDMGAELQQPFAWALIGGMIVGTIVSLLGIPLIYRMIYKK
ncbi:MAG: efflux RND transporter permease subunit [Marinilabiliaceae bacterium]|nr:efflux RND transporter permease subunit [Marinilabiliaceae bacterium]